MLAHDLIPVLERDYELKLTDVAEMDITDFASISAVLWSFSPDLVINCAAYTAVDKAENEGKMLNYQVNALGVWLLAKGCKESGADLIHISTDYVFDGTSEKGYAVDDACKPLNEYGMAKRMGEKLARQHLPDTIIVRTAWLYGGGVDFPNFVNTMIKLGTEKDTLTVVNDQHGLPTYTVDLANAIHLMTKDMQKYRWSTQHFTNSGEKSISRYEFTKEIHRQAGIDCEVSPCGSEVYVRPAARPTWSELINESEVQLPEWKDGLGRYLVRL